MRQLMLWGVLALGLAGCSDDTKPSTVDSASSDRALASDQRAGEATVAPDRGSADQAATKADQSVTKLDQTVSKPEAAVTKPDQTVSKPDHGGPDRGNPIHDLSRPDGATSCKPKCDAVGSKSEGWYDGCTAKLIRWDDCASCSAVCRHKGSYSQGWYDSCDDALIKYDLTCVP